MMAAHPTATKTRLLDIDTLLRDERPTGEQDSAWIDGAHLRDF
jgi:hypothetical protein